MNSPFKQSNLLRVSGIVGPYTVPPNDRICYDIPSFPASDDNDSIEFALAFSVNRKAALASKFVSFSPYDGDAKVFDDGYSAIDYIKDPDKKFLFIDHKHSVSVKKWIMRDRRKRHCVEDEVS